MEISNNLIKEIEKHFEEFQKTGKNSFELSSFKGVFVFFNTQPKKILFPFGEIKGVKVVIGSD